MSEEEDKDEREWDRTAAGARALAHGTEVRARAPFSEVRGLCRTCAYALIRRRELSDVPTVVCSSDLLYMNPQRVPLDVMECSGYRREGEMHLRDMHRLGLLLDTRDKGGQYL